MKIPLLKFLLKNYDKIIFIFILIIASFYRLYKITDYMTFLGDEGRDVLVVYKILHGDLTLLGPTASVGGFFLGPIYYYFMAPFLWLFNYNPVGPAIMVALFGVATVGIIYKIGREFFGSFVGLIASGVFAISPLVVIYSRSSWNPNLMPFFSLSTLYLIYKAVKNNNVKLFILSGLLFGITMQLHYLALFLGVVIFVYLLSYHFVYSKSNFFPRILKQYGAFFIGFVVGWSLFLAFEIRHGFPNIISIFNFIFNPVDTHGSGRFFETVGNVFFRLFGRLITNFPPPDKVSLFTKVNIDLWYSTTLILGIVSVGFLFFKCFKEYKLRSLEFTKISLIVVWFVFGVGLFGFYKKSIYDYYFGFMFPLPFLIIAFFLKNLWQKKIGKLLVIFILIIIIYLNNLTPPFKASANRQLLQTETISKFVLEKTNNKPFNFALITGGNSDHAYRYFFTVWQKEPTVIHNEKIDPNRKTVTNQLLVVCETVPNCHPLGNSLWEIAGFGRAQITDSWDVSVVKVYRLIHYKGNEN
ncbi:MAG: glycosyltransferase family 39 protein [Candidatus Levybacteria bacterium]|nr:glycosyltransferase family 39 protein [Candidatus Levybacteria bacterium]